MTQQETELLILRKMYQRLFTSDDGQKVLTNLEKTYFIDQPTFQGDVNVCIHNEGSRRVILHIKRMMEKMKGEE